MTIFWRNWMYVWIGSVALFGVILCGAASEATSGATRFAFEVLRRPLPADLGGAFRFTTALCGAVTLGWALTFLAIVQAAWDATPAAAARIWRAVTVSVAVWFVIDSGVSVATGYTRNAISNSLLVIAYLIPVLRTGVLRG